MLAAGSMLTKGILGSVIAIIALVLIAQILGQITSLLNFIVQHFMTLMLMIVGTGIVISMVLYIKKRNLEMKNMIVFTGFMVVMFMLLVFILPALGANFNTYSAKATYKVCNRWFGNVIVETASVHDFEETNIFNIIQPPKLGWVWTAVQSRIYVICGDSKVDEKLDSFTIAENTCTERTITINNLPPSTRCQLVIDLTCDECSPNPEWSDYFITPRRLGE